MSNVKDKLLTQEREAVLDFRERSSTLLNTNSLWNAKSTKWIEELGILNGTDNVGIPFISQTISTPVLYKM